MLKDIQPQFDFSAPSKRRAKQAAADEAGLDVELYCDPDIKKHGSLKGVMHPSAMPWTAAHSTNNNPTELWHPGAAPPWRKPPKKVFAHNAIFEFLCVKYVLAPRYGWTEIPFENFSCTMARANSLALPAAAGNLAEALATITRKDADGRKLMLAINRQKRLKGKDPTPEQLEKLGAYCIGDHDVAREFKAQLPELSATEQQVFQLDFKINYEIGFGVDLPSLEGAQKIIEETAPEQNAEVARRTGGEIQSLNQTKKLLPWEQARGYRGQSLRKDVVAQQLAQNPSIDPDASHVLEMRQEGGSAHKKIPAFIAHACDDGRVYGAFRYHAAGTGRWSSTGIQIQNLRRSSVDPEKLDDLFDAVRSGSLRRLKKLTPNPLTTLGSLVRPMIIAGDGHELVGGDYSAIEARCLAWIANDPSLDQFAKYDASGNPEHEPYRIDAGQILGIAPGKVSEEQRKIGKVCTLAFGYMGSVPAWENFSPGTHTPEQVLRFRDRWRALRPDIVKLWYRLDRSCIWAVKHPGELARCHPFDIWSTGSFLFIQLPSGRCLSYPFPAIQRNQFGNGDCVVFMDAQKGQFAPCRHGRGSFPGLWIENITQAISRDILAEALLRVNCAGLDICMHCHDEIVIEAPKGSVDLNAFKRLMITKPRWCQTLPINAEIWRNTRYLKS